MDLRPSGTGALGDESATRPAPNTADAQTEVERAVSSLFNGVTSSDVVAARNPSPLSHHPSGRADADDLHSVHPLARPMRPP